MHLRSNIGFTEKIELLLPFLSIVAGFIQRKKLNKQFKVLWVLMVFFGCSNVVGLFKKTPQVNYFCNLLIDLINFSVTFYLINVFNKTEVYLKKYFIFLILFLGILSVDLLIWPIGYYRESLPSIYVHIHLFISLLDYIIYINHHNKGDVFYKNTLFFIWPITLAHAVSAFLILLLFFFFDYATFDPDLILGLSTAQLIYIIQLLFITRSFLWLPPKQPFLKSL